MARSGLADLLSAWLPAQRWFAGTGRQVRVEIASDIALAEGATRKDGPPGLRHVLADAWLGQERVSYQVPVGIRAELPAALADDVFGQRQVQLLGLAQVGPIERRLGDFFPHPLGQRPEPAIGEHAHRASACGCAGLTQRAHQRAADGKARLAAGGE